MIDWQEVRNLDPSMLNALTAGGILLGFLLVAFLVRMVWSSALKPFSKHLNTSYCESIMLTTRRFAVLGLMLTGLYWAANTLDYLQVNEKPASLFEKAYSMVWVALIVWTALRLFNAATANHIRNAQTQGEVDRSIAHRTGLVRKIVNITVLVLGMLYVLRAAGVDIGPLIASGAVGGLAVALALQDTFSNLIAGFLMTVDRPFKVGDFIKLESGEEGFVEEIGWRNTKVRLLANNLVILPNSKMSQSMITNYYLPELGSSVLVPCGVSYDSDLQHVEEIAIEVAREVLQQVEGADKSWEPAVRWKEFGDSSINFVTVLRGGEIGDQIKLKSAFIKALHRRFSEEDIEIPFPIRTVILKTPEGESLAEVEEALKDAGRGAK